jgi:hypothetical protein
MRIKFPPRYFSNPQSFYGSFPSINTERKYASFSIPQHSLAMAKPRICLSRCRIKIITYIFFLSYFLLNYQKFKISIKNHKKRTRVLTTHSFTHGCLQPFLITFFFIGLTWNFDSFFLQ